MKLPGTVPPNVQKVYSTPSEIGITISFTSRCTMTLAGCVCEGGSGTSGGAVSTASIGSPTGAPRSPLGRAAGVAALTAVGGRNPHDGRVRDVGGIRSRSVSVSPCGGICTFFHFCSSSLVDRIRLDHADRVLHPAREPLGRASLADVAQVGPDLGPATDGVTGDAHAVEEHLALGVRAEIDRRHAQLTRARSSAWLGRRGGGLGSQPTSARLATIEAHSPDTGRMKDLGRMTLSRTGDAGPGEESLLFLTVSAR